MTRTQLQIDDATYEALRARAYRERRSMSAVVREILRGALSSERKPGDLRGVRFSFVGSGASGRGDISANHDEVLAEDFA